MNGLLVIQALRPDRLTDMARVFVEKVLGSSFAHAADKELDLASIVENEVRMHNFKPQHGKQCIMAYAYICS